MKRRTGLALALCLLFVAVGYAQSQQVIGSKRYITKEIKVTGFDAIKLMGSSDIIYKQVSGEPSVQIYGSDNIVTLVETYVEDGTLIVKFKKNTNIQSSRKLEIRVSSPALKQLSIYGSGDVTFANGLNSNNDVALAIYGSGDMIGNGFHVEKLTIDIAGSGDVSLSDIACKQIKSSISGSGDIKLTGTATNAAYRVSGSGDINASALKAEQVSAQVNGSGDISCHAIKQLDGSVSGSGGVAYKGSPQISFSKKGLRKL